MNVDQLLGGWGGFMDTAGGGAFIALIGTIIALIINGRRDKKKRQEEIQSVKDENKLNRDNNLRAIENERKAIRKDQHIDKLEQFEEDAHVLSDKIDEYHRLSKKLDNRHRLLGSKEDPLSRIDDFINSNYMSQYSKVDNDVYKAIPKLKESARRLSISLPESKKKLDNCVVILEDYFKDSTAVPEQLEDKKSMVSQVLGELRAWTTQYKEGA